MSTEKMFFSWNESGYVSIIYVKEKRNSKKQFNSTNTFGEIIRLFYSLDFLFYLETNSSLSSTLKYNLDARRFQCKISNYFFNWQRKIDGERFPLNILFYPTTINHLYITKSYFFLVSTKNSFSIK
jgi:hypothetical protein